MELYNGRPTDLTGREDREIRVYDLLDSLGIEYQRTDHGHADTMEACNEIDAVLDVLICKNLFLCNRQKTDFYLLMMPGDKPFKTKELSKQIGSARLSFATPDFMLEFLDIKPGAVSVMGLMNDKDNRVRLLVDEDVLKGEYVGCHPCVNTSSLKIKTADVFGKYLDAVHHTATTVKLILFIDKISDDILTGYDTDKSTEVIGYGDKVLIHCPCKKLVHTYRNFNRRIKVGTEYVTDTKFFLFFNIARSLFVNYMPQEVTLAHRADIFSVTGYNRDSGVAVSTHFFKSLS